MGLSPNFMVLWGRMMCLTTLENSIAADCALAMLQQFYKSASLNVIFVQALECPRTSTARKSYSSKYWLIGLGLGPWWIAKIEALNLTQNTYFQNSLNPYRTPAQDPQLYPNHSLSLVWCLVRSRSRDTQRQGTLVESKMSTFIPWQGRKDRQLPYGWQPQVR